MYKTNVADFCCDLCLERVEADDLHVRIAAEVGVVSGGKYISTSAGVRVFGLFHVACIESTRDNSELASEVPYLTEAREILDGATTITTDSPVASPEAKSSSFLS